MKKTIVYLTTLLSVCFVCFSFVQHAAATTYISEGEFYLDETTVPQGKIVVGQSGQIRPLQDGPLKDFQQPYHYSLSSESSRTALEIDDTGHWKAVGTGKVRLNVYLNDFSDQFRADMKKYDIGFRTGPTGLNPTIGYLQVFDIEVVPPTSPVYRLYHPDLKVHLYTTDENEFRILGNRGWNQEGQAWTTNNATGTPVYRLYQPDLKVHLYTMDKNEYAVLATRGWNQEGEAYKSSGSTPVYRLYHSGIKKHLYTRDANEKNVLSTRGWRYEGVAWNVE
ncbi:hypothetical protein [Streptococcus cuniculi]|uniref:DUF5648 domain-containing protein n=1 Tax=Streptococcus cuniculi TaxID=1432788 RepID=A0A4Y9JB80_9STRE|nr:hypothetical protein [Streptococcus cuniculi]MBF0777971.1 hypothetical protein [Streptococcus cuniculi]TFU98263.1 hypothetical protein E4T82_04475 [Streptococcus cuniculi]